MPDHDAGAAPSVAPMFSRRRVLAGGGRGLLAMALVGTSAAACGSGTPPAPDPLEAQLAAARSDSELAAAAAKAAPRPSVPALNEVASERARHAAALVEELARAAGKPTPTSTDTSATPTSAAAGAQPAPPPPTLQDVTAALRKSAESAAALVPTLSGYRAGLMGSIAAACTASYVVGLPPPPPEGRRKR